MDYSHDNVTLALRILEEKEHKKKRNRKMMVNYISTHALVVSLAIPLVLLGEISTGFHYPYINDRKVQEGANIFVLLGTDAVFPWKHPFEDNVDITWYDMGTHLMPKREVIMLFSRYMCVAYGAKRSRLNCATETGNAAMTLLQVTFEDVGEYEVRVIHADEGSVIQEQKDRTYLRVVNVQDIYYVLSINGTMHHSSKPPQTPIQSLPPMVISSPDWLNVTVTSDLETPPPVVRIWLMTGDQARPQPVCRHHYCNRYVWIYDDGTRYRTSSHATLYVEVEFASTIQNGPIILYVVDITVNHREMAPHNELPGAEVHERTKEQNDKLLNGDLEKSDDSSSHSEPRTNIKEYESTEPSPTVRAKHEWHSIGSSNSTVNETTVSETATSKSFHDNSRISSDRENLLLSKHAKIHGPNKLQAGSHELSETVTAPVGRTPVDVDRSPLMAAAMVPNGGVKSVSYAQRPKLCAVLLWFGVQFLFW